jgi:Calcineurin-like phosphoesterase
VQGGERRLEAARRLRAARAGPSRPAPPFVDRLRALLHDPPASTSTPSGVANGGGADSSPAPETTRNATHETALAARMSAPREVVVVHSSDLHVDDNYTAALYGGDGAGGLVAVLDAARTAAADAVVLAGDVFEHNRLPLAVVARAARLMAEAGVPVVILPGNHDPATPDSVWRRGPLAEPDNVHILGVTHEETVGIDALGLELWGRAHLDYNDMAPLGVPPARRARFRIAVAHGHYDPVPATAGAPRPGWLFGDAEIAAADADYLALGHWNRAVRVGKGRIEAHYSGSPDFAGTVNVVRLGPAGVTVERAAVRLGAGSAA